MKQKEKLTSCSYQGFIFCKIILHVFGIEETGFNIFYITYTQVI